MGAKPSSAWGEKHQRLRFDTSLASRAGGFRGRGLGVSRVGGLIRRRSAVGTRGQNSRGGTWGEVAVLSPGFKHGTSKIRFCFWPNAKAKRTRFMHFSTPSRGTYALKYPTTNLSHPLNLSRNTSRSSVRSSGRRSRWVPRQDRRHGRGTAAMEITQGRRQETGWTTIRLFAHTRRYEDTGEMYRDG